MHVFLEPGKYQGGRSEKKQGNERKKEIDGISPDFQVGED